MSVEINENDEFVPKVTLHTTEDIRKWLVDELIAVVGATIENGFRNMVEDTENMADYDIEGEYNEGVVHLISDYIHECDIDERDEYAIASGQTQSLLLLLWCLGFPSTEKERNLKEWAEAIANQFV